VFLFSLKLKQDQHVQIWAALYLAVSVKPAPAFSPSIEPLQKHANEEIRIQRRWIQPFWRMIQIGAWISRPVKHLHQGRSLTWWAIWLPMRWRIKQKRRFVCVFWEFFKRALTHLVFNIAKRSVGHCLILVLCPHQQINLWTTVESWRSAFAKVIGCHTRRRELGTIGEIWKIENGSHFFRKNQFLFQIFSSASRIRPFMHRDFHRKQTTLCGNWHLAIMGQP